MTDPWAESLLADLGAARDLDEELAVRTVLERERWGPLAYPDRIEHREDLDAWIVAVGQVLAENKHRLRHLVAAAERIRIMVRDGNGRTAARTLADFVRDRYGVELRAAPWNGTSQDRATWADRACIAAAPQPAPRVDNPDPGPRQHERRRSR